VRESTSPEEVSHEEAGLLIAVNLCTMALLERRCPEAKGVETNADHPPLRQRMMPEAV
jgi:hypothetical protein